MTLADVDVEIGLLCSLFRNAGENIKVAWSYGPSTHIPSLELTFSHLKIGRNLKGNARLPIIRYLKGRQSNLGKPNTVLVV